MKIITPLILAITICNTPQGFADDCLGNYLQRDIIKEIVASRTVGHLRKLRAQKVFRNDVTRAIYSFRMYELRPSAATEESLIQTLPQSDLTLALLYRLTYPEAVPAGGPQLFDRYLDTAYRVIRKSRRRYPALLRLAVLVQGGDLGEAVSNYVDRLYDSDPEGVSQLLLAMPDQEERLICGEDAIPCPTKKGHR